MQDNTATIVVARFAVAMESFDGVAAAGPVPTWFSVNPEATLIALKKSPDMAHAMCQALAKRIIKTEELNQEQAAEYVKAPRQGVEQTPFLREWVAPKQDSPPKKQKTDQESGPHTSSGKLSLVI